ncbi:conserved hypothetical protein [Shewanella halifaxensis HAW-EB4]|uniref:DUF3293 domain-containing protein n=1 Tax=Shewanella halifaxensis (strain HAW-EB4) TaxID=458817 RepID=B0TTL9_SHEHH|nr:DUF3293 domain-containing protein [Shewanella halifaxensis]ABZ75362.1 conserved hypothetical protein [Shewanella halifaxensis HAW-EB4]
MNDSIETLWRFYKETEFLFTQILSSQLSFAIITAYNPCGEVLTACQNGLLDRKLQHEIHRLGLPYRAMIGTSHDRKHMEKSWAVVIDKAQAVKLGCQFNQNAIYYVEADCLHLIPCLVAKFDAHLGAFSPRVKLLLEFPDIG